MWNKGKQSISAGDDSINVIAGRDVNIVFPNNAPTELINQKIDEEVDKLRKSRFFPEFDETRSSVSLGRRLAEGDLSGGSDEIRGWGLAWCARILSTSDDLERAEVFLERARSLRDSPEAKIAAAFISSRRIDKTAALQALADIDSHASRSAGLMIVAHHDGAEDALRWMNDAGYTVGDLDSDGKSFLISQQLQLGRWDEAVQTSGLLSDVDFDETPVLYHWAALSRLVPAIPQVLRAIVLAQIPFEARGFPLASDAAAMDTRREAHQYFLDAVEAAEQLGCPLAARMDDEYALWLELRDPTQTVHGKTRLEDKLRDSNTALGFVHHALQFGIKLDLATVERDIERSIAINGGLTIDAATARFALAFTQPTPAAAANYISRHFNQLAAHIDIKQMRSLQIEMFSRAGLIEKANEVFDHLLEEGISPELESSLRSIIAKAQGSDPIEYRKAQYESTPSLLNLINLVAELEDHERWEDLCEFGKSLFEETHSLGDAERLVNAFNNAHKSEALVGFLRENVDLLSQSNRLRMSYAWGLYHEGAFLESRAALMDLTDQVGSPNYRALQVNLDIATGDWANLAVYVADEYRNRESKTAHDLIHAAQLALHLGLPQAKDLVFEATATAIDDSVVLATAYFIATNAGWEDDPQVFQWLEKAAQLSGDDGPLQKASLKDILDRKPEWDRHESEIWRLLVHGQAPIFLAAQSLNRTLIDLMVFPALANLTENDPRRRSAIPTYSGKRVPLEFDVSGKAIALDATALLTLSFLNILDVTLDTFEAVLIPHSTLGWLFEERQRAAFHQPSRIANARRIRDMLATDVLEKFAPSTVASSDLSAQIGDELAALIAEAEKVRDSDDTQHIVVRSAPVYRLSSLMEEEADLSAHAAVLSSCLAVVEKLRRKGQITADEEKRARIYFQLHEKPWSGQPDIADGATLYLDDLAMTHLLHLGLLGKLKAAGLTAVTSPRTVSETNSLISYARIAEEVKDIIERVRTSLGSRIESGRVRFGRRRNIDGFEENSILEHPSIGVLGLAPQCDMAIIDDRFLNQHGKIDDGGAQAPVFSTLDLLDALVVSGILSDDDRLEHRTRLRRAGYLFVPVTVDELERCLGESTIANGNVVETAELKAIRESFLRVRMSDWLQLPEEVPWLDGILKAFVRVLRNLWQDEGDLEEITARSDWLVKQIDVRGWAHSVAPENADSFVQIGRVVYIQLLLTPPTKVPQSVVDAYWNWVEERVLKPLQEQFPVVYDWLVDWYRGYIAHITEAPLLEEDNS